MAPSSYQMTDFQNFMAANGLTESTRKQVIVAMRRALSRVGPDRLLDPNELLLYRMGTPEATRRLFGYAWTKFQDYMASKGESIPDLPKMPVIKLVHPLWADLTDLSVHLNVHRIETLKFRDIADEDPDLVERPARRAFEFITGRQPLEIDWLVPRDALAASPMPFWMLDTILRTHSTEDSRDVEKAVFGLLQTTTRRGISASDLRDLWTEVTSLVSGISGRRRLVRLDSLEIDSDEPWGTEDQELVMSVLRGASKVEDVIDSPATEASDSLST